ncbi:MAG TPA: LacI family DNA-binding transcriptional regulator [Clostridia bacterium]
MVTLKDIAQKCGVSVGAVSKALNDSPDISVETKQYIREVALNLGYRPNFYARTLKTNRSYNIGILFDDNTNNGFGHAFFSNIISSFRRLMEFNGYDLTFIARNSQDKYTYVDHARHRKLDGVFVACVDYYNDDGVLELLESEIPAVAIDYMSDKFACVYSDNYSGLMSLVDYCVEMGHKKIAFIHGQHTCVTEQRVKGYKDALAKNNIPFREEYLVEGEYYSIDMTYKRVQELMKLSDPPSCIILSDDYCMFGAQKAAFDLGLSIPWHVSIAGFDDIRIAPYFSPPLTTVRQDAVLIGKTAAEIILYDIEKKTKSNHNIEIPTVLIKRGSIRKIS